MINPGRSMVPIAVAAALVAPSLANAQHPAAVGDLMTAFVQPRHVKLGLAGSEKNWPYAAYELDQLRETLADIAEILPKYRVRSRLRSVDRGVQHLPSELRSRRDCDPAGDRRRFSRSGFPPGCEIADCVRSRGSLCIGPGLEAD